MPRRRAAQRRQVMPDPCYNNIVVTKFINCLMYDGKRPAAERILYGAVDRLQKKAKSEGVDVFISAIENVKPIAEVRSRRVGGATYPVPIDVRAERAEALAIRWLIKHSRKRKERTMEERLAAEMLEASEGRGASIKQKDDTHKMAEANKAFLHYRW